MKIGVDNISSGLSTSPGALGGMRMYLKNCIESLLNEEQTCQIIMFSPEWYVSPFPAGLDRFKEVRLKVSSRRLLRVIFEQTLYRRAIQRIAPDVFLGMCNIVPLKLRTPSVLLVKSLQFLHYPEAYGRFQLIYQNIFTRLSARTVTLVVVPTESCKVDLLQVMRVPEDKIRVVPEALYIKNTNILESDQGSALRACVEQLTGKRPFLLCVGATYGYKNLDRLIAAFAHLKITQNLPHVLLLIGGETSVSFKSLASKAHQHDVAGSVILAGAQPHDVVVAAYNMAELMVMPTLYETFGHPVLEAMACGCPVVTSNRGAVAEVAGDAAILVDPFQLDEVMEGMRRVLNQVNLRKQLIERGRIRAGNFTWERTAAKLLEVLEEAANF